MNRVQNALLAILTTSFITFGGAIFAALHIFGRILDRIDARHEAEIMRRLRRIPRNRRGR